MADPRKHFTTHIVIIEVTPARTTGSGISGTRVEREKEEVLSLTLRDEELDEALERTISMLNTFREGQP